MSASGVPRAHRRYSLAHQRHSGQRRLTPDEGGEDDHADPTRRPRTHPGRGARRSHSLPGRQPHHGGRGPCPGRPDRHGGERLPLHRRTLRRAGRHRCGSRPGRLRAGHDRCRGRPRPGSCPPRAAGAGRSFSTTSLPSRSSSAKATASEPSSSPTCSPKATSGPTTSSTPSNRATGAFQAPTSVSRSCKRSSSPATGGVGELADFRPTRRSKADAAIQKGAVNVLISELQPGDTPRSAGFRTEGISAARRAPRPCGATPATAPLLPFGCGCPSRAAESRARRWRKGASIMRAQRARRLAAVSAAGLLMAGGAAIGTAGTAAAAAPAVHTQVTTNWCGDRGDWGGRCFDRFDHHGFRFDHRFDHHRFFNQGGVVIIVL